MAVNTTCPYCGVGCGIVANPASDGAVTIRGDKDHPANFGRLCSKGSALGDTVDLNDRLLYPEIEGERCDWETALTMVAEGFSSIIDEHGPDAVAFYVSGQLLTEDYYVANKLMKGFIGSANIDTNSRLCMSSSVAGHKRAFGADIVPGNYEDLEQAELIVLAGTNMAWCHPVLFQRITQAKKDNPALKVVVIDPRRTATCELADIHLPLKPGTDTVLWNGLLNYLQQHGAVNYQYLETYCENYAPALEVARDSSPSVFSVANQCGLSAGDVERFFQLFLSTEKVVSAYSQGVNQSSCGTDKVNAIINCHLLTGRIGRPGMGPFSLTGQPNAMGGREVGGLANQLAAHMEIGNPQHRDLVQRFWQAPSLAEKEGLKAVDLFDAMLSGQVKAVWIIATNPVVSMPDADKVKKALRRCELVVVSDCVRNTDTTACADILLPALAWGEKDGTVTNSERRISRQRPFLPAPGEARADWWIGSEVAKPHGYADAFAYDSAAAIFREHAQLSAFENNGARDFDLGGLAELTDQEYSTLSPLQWPVNAQNRSGLARFFADGSYYTPSRKAQFVAIYPRAPVNPPDADYPLILNTGRVRDHWHTLTRTGKSARLSSHIAEPYVELHPDDAARLRLQQDALAQIVSRWGEMVARVNISSDQQVGSVFVPMHWNDQFAFNARIDAVVNPATDPISGEPEFKHTPVKVVRYFPAWHGFVLSRRAVRFERLGYQVRIPGNAFTRYELAGDSQPDDWAGWARDHLCAPHDDVEWIDYLDAAAGYYRGARLLNNRLESCIFIAPGHQLPPRTWLGELFLREQLSVAERASLLAGRPGKGQSDSGRVICACFNVGEKTLLSAIKADGLQTVEAVGQCLKAGTNCGSCIPEIRALIHGGK